MFRSKKAVVAAALLLFLLAAFDVLPAVGMETREEFDRRMAWWREARFGLFIHWGLYAIPAGQWKKDTNHAEWILTTAQIPVSTYEKFASRFNPVQFNAADWVRMAREAGMKYIVITSKHHDGFCLFDSKLTDYDVMDATPFKRDILKELADECRKQGLRICWYHSIMDWHHPDYLPRRGWENRSDQGAEFDRYVSYLKGQIKELLTNYGDIGVLWFDGEWERTWNYAYGQDLYDYVRSLDQDIIINNRVGKGRAGMSGTFDPETSAGDFGTPEQTIPATGLDYDWETCMTMNQHWGYNRFDRDWKSSEDLIQKLVDIVSKGGNFLLNVGPTAEGVFPQPSVERLADIGKWMKVNGESIYGTTASLFEGLEWGRSTTKGSALYFHVFTWPEDGELKIPGLLTRAESALLLADPDRPLSVTYGNGSAVIHLPREAPDDISPVVVLRFKESPEVVRSPAIKAQDDIFIDELAVSLESNLEDCQIKYTLDGSDPSLDAETFQDVILLKETTVVRCQVFRGGLPVSAVTERRFSRVEPRPAEKLVEVLPGLRYGYFQGDWDRIPDFDSLTPVDSGISGGFSLKAKQQPEFFGFLFRGYVRIPRDGVYHFGLVSDDGSRLWIGDQLVVDNDGLHGSTLAKGRIALQAGLQPIRVEFFQKTGGVDFGVFYSGPDIQRRQIPPTVLFHKE